MPPLHADAWRNSALRGSVPSKWDVEREHAHFPQMYGGIFVPLLLRADGIAVHSVEALSFTGAGAL
jgi:hypothetical protein